MTITASSSTVLDLSTRDVHVIATQTTVSATSTDNTSVTIPTGATLGPDDFIPLPRIGERVQLVSYGRSITGIYLGRAEHSEGAMVTAFVLNGEHVTLAAAPASVWDARTAVVDSLQPEPAVVEVLAVLAESCRDRARDKAAHQQWIDNLVADAHDWADRNDLCSAFDNFMDEHSLPSRVEDFEVLVNVTLSTQVTVTRSARSWADAEESVDRDAVREALGSRYGYSLLADLDFDYDID